MSQGGHSVVLDQGPYASSCGYCKSNGRTSVSYGIWAQSLTVHDYQGLLDQGWRRSGMFLYKPQMEKTCCPPYTIRLRVDSFIPSKKQNHVLRRMKRHLDGNGPQTIGKLQRESNVLPERSAGSIYEDSQPSVSTRTSESSDVVINNVDTCHGKAKNKDKTKNTEIDEVARDLSMAVEASIRTCVTSGELPPGLVFSKVSVQRIHSSLKRRLKDLTGNLEYTCSVAFPIAATLKHMHADKKLKNVTSECEPKTGAQKENVQEPSAVTLAELLSSKLQSDALLHGLTVEACRGHMNFLSVKSSDSEHQSCVQAVSPADYTFSENKEAVLKTTTVRANSVPEMSKLEIRMRRSEFDPEEFALYKRYQIAVHKDKPEDVRESSYRRFLVDSPLTFIPPSDDSTPFCGFGSFHQQYLIDGRLVAVGVVDVLPCCLSSKYLFWDPDLSFLSLGKYSALREIMWVQEAHKYWPALEFYYLGYYIHSCKKMRYKAEYVPSELLCPVRFQWVPFHISHPLLDKQSYVCLSDYLGDSKITKDSLSLSESVEAEAQDIEFNEVGSPRSFNVSQSIEVASSSKESEDVSNVMLKIGGQFIRFKHLEAWSAIPRNHMDRLVYHLRKYSQVVGPALAARMAYAV